MADEMFNEAVKALRAGQRMRAKDLLTRLLKTEQSNIDYWIWMSAAVDTEKEQLYCLQNALKLDPNSPAARRGLVMLGALKPEEANMPPVALLEPSALALPNLSGGGASEDTGSGGGFKGFWSRPRNQQMVFLAGAGLVALVLVGVLFNAFLVPILFKPPPQVVVVTSTPTPNETATAIAQKTTTAEALTTLTPRARTSTATPTLEPCSQPPNPDPATPLAFYLCVTPQVTQIPFTPDSSSQEDFQTLKRSYTNGEWSKILERATIILRDTTLNKLASTHFYVAEAYRNTNNIDAALPAYDKALGINGQLAPALWGRALANLAINRTTAATRDFDAALAADPSFTPAHVDRAAYQLASGDVATALTNLEAARLIAPQNPLVLAYLSLAYAAAGRGQEAFDTAEAARAADPGLPLAYYARGLAAYVLGDYVNADRDLGTAYRYLQVGTFPGANKFRAQLMMYVGLVKVALADDAAAITFFTQGLSADDKFSDLYILRGSAYLRGAQFEPARSDFNTALNQIFTVNPNDPRMGPVFLGRGEALLGQNKLTDALKDLKEAARRMPDQYLAVFTYGRALVQANEAEDAVTVLETALALALDNPQVAQALVYRAQAYRQLGQLDLAIADLTRASEVAANDDPSQATAIAVLTQIGPLATATPVPSATSPATATSAATATARVTATSAATSAVTATPQGTATREGTPPGTPKLSATPTRPTPTPRP